MSDATTSDAVTLDALRRSFDDPDGVTMLPPIHPGEILREEFMVPLGLSSGAVAKALHLPRSRIERIVKEEIGISADTALRLARYFRTSHLSGSISRPGSRARRFSPRSGHPIWRTGTRTSDSDHAVRNHLPGREAPPSWRTATRSS